MSTLPARYYADLVGKPYQRHARGPESYDCVGLVLEVTRRMGTVLPAYLSDPAELHRILAADGSMLGELTRVTEPLPGDVALLRTGVGSFHVGVMLDRWTLLNSREGANAAVERLLSPLLRGRVLGIYRLPKAAEVRA